MSYDTKKINKSAQEYKVNETKRTLHIIRGTDVLEMNMKLFCAEELEAAFKACVELVYKNLENKKYATIETWLSRNHNGFLIMHDTKSETNIAEREWISREHIGLLLEDFPTVTWDNKPKKVKVTIELEEEV